LPGNRATIHKEGIRLIIEPVSKPSLLSMLSTLQPLDEDFPEIEDPSVSDDELVF
jgi:antitoxin VapB